MVRTKIRRSFAYIIPLRLIGSISTGSSKGGLAMAVQNKQISNFKVIGIKTRTSNDLEMSGNGKIGSVWGEFMSKGLKNKIPHRVNENTIAVYCEYESDASGPYTFFLGAVVDSTKDLPPGMVAMEIPADNYEVFTTDKGEIPGIVISAWEKIWNLESSKKIKRKYGFDYEMYDSRAADPKSAQVDLYISVKN